jgi:hypothetical protein
MAGYATEIAIQGEKDYSTVSDSLKETVAIRGEI